MGPNSHYTDSHVPFKSPTYISAVFEYELLQ